MPIIHHQANSKYTIGADPEIFLVDVRGKFISAVGKFGGTKEAPIPLGNFYGLHVQEDNVAVEFNTLPVQSAQAFQGSIQYALQILTEKATKLELKLAIVPSAEFPDEELQTPQAKTFGCDPDFNVWTLKTNPRPKTTNKNLRSAGGHIHIGYIKDRIGLGRACDLFLGIPSLLFDPDKNRRLLYGKAGCIRQKTYGIEYRTLSNFWLKSKELTNMVWNQTMQAIKFIEDGKTIPNDDCHKIIKAINNSDASVVPELTEKYGLQY